jgi:hypothetical protein
VQCSTRRGLTAAGDALHLHDVAVAGGDDVRLHGVPRRLDDILCRPHPVQRLVGAEAGAAPQPLGAVRAGRIPLQLRYSGTSTGQPQISICGDVTADLGLACMPEHHIVRICWVVLRA